MKNAAVNIASLVAKPGPQRHAYEARSRDACPFRLAFSTLTLATMSGQATCRRAFHRVSISPRFVRTAQA
jgi:hypothetical protein